MPRIAIAGGGKAGRRHRAAWAQLRDVEVVASAGFDPATRASQQPLDAYHELLRRGDVEAVDVCVPGGAQAEVGIAAARAGKHVLVEQFRSPALGEADQLIDACRDAGVRLDVVQPWRWLPVVQAMKGTAGAGRLGTIKFGHYCDIAGETVTGDSFDDPAAGGCWQEGVVDALDLMAWLVGKPVVGVFARGCALAGAGEAPHYASILLRFAGGAQAVCEIGRIQGLPIGASRRRLALTGLRGTASHDLRDEDVLVNRSGLRPLADDLTAETARALHDWAAGFAGHPGTSAPTVVGEARAALQVALAAQDSASTGRPVAVEAAGTSGVRP